VFFALGTEAVSVISMRPANKNERKLHAEYQEEGLHRARLAGSQ
jgi:uncharacterized DUF497 family protein